MAERVDGVVIEGVDYIGKTTTAQAVLELIVEAGLAKPRYRKCYMGDSPLVRFLDQSAKAHSDLETRDWYYTCALLLDLQEPLDAGEPRLQERHSITQIGRNLFFHGDRLAQPLEAIWSRRPTFAVSVFLTSSVEVKRERSAGRAAKSPRDELLAADPALNQAYEDFLLTLLPEQEAWRIIDTTERGPADVAAEIVDAYRAARGAAQPPVNPSGIIGRS